MLTEHQNTSSDFKHHVFLTLKFSDNLITMDTIENVTMAAAMMEKVTFTEIAEVTTGTAETETEHPEAYLYQVAYDFFMYMDPIILIVGLVGNTLSFLVMQVGYLNCFESF